MSLNITFKKVRPSEALKEHVTKKVEKFQKFVKYPLETHVILNLEKMFHCVEINCHAEHRSLAAIAKSKDLYESIDLAVQKIEKQLKKEREMRKGHKSARLANRPKSLKLAKDVNADLPHREKKLAEVD